MIFTENRNLALYDFFVPALIMTIDRFPSHVDSTVDGSMEILFGGALIPKRISTLTWSLTVVR